MWQKLRTKEYTKRAEKQQNKTTTKQQENKTLN